jgi:hypothetical protein
MNFKLKEPCNPQQVASHFIQLHWLESVRLSGCLDSGLRTSGTSTSSRLTIRVIHKTGRHGVWSQTDVDCFSGSKVAGFQQEIVDCKIDT